MHRRTALQSIAGAVLLGAALGRPRGCLADPLPAAGREFRIAGYLPEYRLPGFDLELMARGVTDLLLFSAEPTADGGLNLDRLAPEHWPRLREFKTRARVRLVLSLGGWGRSTHFAAVAGDAVRRRTFVSTVIRTCLAERLDGVDLDWEHPRNNAEEEAYGALLSELRDAFAPWGLQLSATVAGWQRLPAAAIKAVDWLQIMSYDHDGEQATLPAARQDVEQWRLQGAPVEKLVLGLPFYGRHVQRRDQVLTWAQLLERAPAGVDGDLFEGYAFNGPATIRRKVEYARETGLAGVMIWELGQDAAGDRSLLSVIRQSVDAASSGR
jgi:GH18 family chitinase